MLNVTRQKLVGVGVGILLGIPTWMLMDRREPVELVSGTIEPYHAAIGDTVKITWRMVERRRCDGDFSRAIRDAAGKISTFAVAPTTYQETAVRTTDDIQSFTKEFIIPDGLTLGPAFYYVQGRRWCNYAQQKVWPIAFKSPEISFCVIDPSVPAAGPCLRRVGRARDGPPPEELSGSKKRRGPST